MDKHWTVYLSGEIHTDWRDRITAAPALANAPVRFHTPVTDHAMSDDCGVSVTGPEEDAFWHDRKGALLNGARIRTLIGDSDIVVVCFGEKYKQWNAAFDAGYAAALGKPLIVLQRPEHNHALKEVDAAAALVCNTPEQVARGLNYIIAARLD